MHCDVQVSAPESPASDSESDRQSKEALPKISVVLPAHNAEKWLAETLDSYVAQTLQSFEIIVIDDGSTDRTPAIAETYRGVLKLRLMSIPASGGPAKPRNIGHDMAIAPLIVYADADDLARTTRLETVWNAWQSVGCANALIFSDYSEIDSAGRTISTSKLSEYSSLAAAPRDCISERVFRLDPSTSLETILAGDFTRPCAIAVPRDVFARIGRYDETLRNAQDYDYYLRCARLFPFVGIDEVLADYRHTPGNISGRSAIERMPSLISVLRKIDQTSLSASARDKIRRWLYDCYVGLGYEYGVRGHPALASAAYLRAISNKVSYVPVKGMVGALFRWVVIACRQRFGERGLL